MKMGEIAQRAGLSRQWISRLADLGMIPGAERTPSGRWHFKPSTVLDEWLTRVGRMTRIRRRRQLLHQDEAEVRRLEKKAAKLRTSPGSRHGKQRLLELTQAIAARRAAISDHLTVRELARATGRSRRWVSGRAQAVPGAGMLRNKWIFEKSEALSDWIQSERRLRNLERKLLPGDIRFPRSHIAWLLSDTYRYERSVLQDTNRVPFSEWQKEEQREFTKRFREMVKQIQRATGITLNA